MNKVVEHGIKADFHIHSIRSLTRDKLDILKNSKIENIEFLVNKLNENNVQMCAITDHDVFDFNMYKELKKYENDDNSSLLKVLPGVEFSVMFKRNGKEKPLHIISLFPDDDEDKLKNIEKVLKIVNDRPDYDCIESFSEERFIQLLTEINLDTILIAHQKQTLSSSSKPKKHDANSLGAEAFNEFVTSEYFEAYEFKNKRNELFNNISKNQYDKDLLRFITGSDCHDWTVYPKHDQNSNDDNFKFTYYKCLPTFKGVAFAITDETRISLEDNFFTVDCNNYIDRIGITVKDEEIDIPLSKGINAIIGDNSIGKSLLLHKLTDYFRKDEGAGTSSLNATVIKGYDEYLDNKNITIDSKIDKNKIFEFDTQGEIRKKFNFRQINGKAFYDKKYPPDVDTTDAKELCLTSLNSLYEYLGAKFRYGDEISKIINLQFLHEDINASNITYD